MVSIASAGLSFTMGSSTPEAAPDEKPPMPVTFTYNYWIDTTEVTQRQYLDCTGKSPVAGSGVYGVGDENPVYYVSWYDAVLFCNARSKRDGLDTVYSYNSFDTLTNGTVFNITGLRTDFSKDGCRLPTEAEWEFAARGGTPPDGILSLGDSIKAASCAWYSANSDDKTHQVATKSRNRFGLYDMAGNVFEWANDWKTGYRSAAITNPVGGEYPDAQYERIIKGGSFEHGVAFLRASNRSATYATTVSAIAEYVGFRCVCGAISSPAFVTADTSAALVTTPTDLLTSSVQQFLGTGGARIVFVNNTGDNQTLCAVNFQEAHPLIREFKDIRTVNNPTLSPDGRYVAFASRGEGLSGSSYGYIRPVDSLASPAVRIPGDSCYIPRWWVDRTTGDTFVIYVNNAIDNALSASASAVTFRQKISGGKALGSREELDNCAGFHDGLSASGRYTVSGFTRLMTRNTVTGLSTHLFISPQNGKDAAGSTQACNVSICPDTVHEGRCLFLDFGYPRTSTVIGSSYNAHEYLFMTDSTGTMLWWMRAPAGTDSWDDVEWSNQPPFAAGIGQLSSGTTDGIYLIDLEQKATLKVAGGVAIREPYLWAADVGSNPAQLALDSLGHYDDPPATDALSQWAAKMRIFWTHRNDVQIVAAGSSQILSGIDCSQFTSAKGINLGYSGCGPSQIVDLMRNYVIDQCPNLSIVILGATPYWLADSGGNGWNPQTAGLTQNKGYLYDKSHQFWKSGLPRGFDELMGKAPVDFVYGLDTLGMADSTKCDGWGPAAPGGRIDWDTSNPVYRQNFAMINSLIGDLDQRQILVVIVLFPENPGFKNTAYFAAGGPSWATGLAYAVQLKALEQLYPHYHFYDAYLSGNHDYGDDDAENQNHLCPVGAKKFTQRLDSLIRSFSP
jgi:uncharacterized protein (TIGR02171 family)